MDFCGKSSGPATPVKDPQSNRSKVSQISKDSENLNPNFTSPNSKLSNSAASKSAKKAQKSAPKNPNPVASPSPRNKIRERKFVVAKKKSKREKFNSSTVSCRCNISGKSQKCVCVAYETLRASQEEFFRNRAKIDDYPDRAENEIEEEEEGMNSVLLNPEIPDGGEENLGENDCLEKNGSDETQVKSEVGSTTVKRRRDKLLEEARQSVPEPGSGRVLHLVKAFEKLLSIPKSKESDEIDDKESAYSKKGMKWALPGLQPKDPETQSLESSGTFGGRQRKRRQHKVTTQKPFKLRTEQRGRSKEEEFNKKVKEMMMEEEKQRIPVAQGLPWTTDEPECLVKPPVKESTRPVDLVLHSDVRAVERAEFDHQVAEKMSFIEQYRMETERQQKLAEEEEIRQLRKELVPRAQPMPYFDRPFIPRRSEKHPTIPKEPRFHLPQHQHKKIKCCMSWNDMSCVHPQWNQVKDCEMKSR